MDQTVYRTRNDGVVVKLLLNDLTINAYCIGNLSLLSLLQFKVTITFHSQHDIKELL